jgi:hypothetical protein
LEGDIAAGRGLPYQRSQFRRYRFRLLRADPYTAEDIADLVAPEIEPLAPCLDPAASPREFAPGRSTEAAVITKAYGATLPLPGK